MDEQLLKIQNSLDKINKQMDKFARKADIKEMEKMIELISPIEEHVRKEIMMKQE